MPLRVQIDDEPDGTGDAAWAAGCVVVLWGKPLLYWVGPTTESTSPAALIAGRLSASCRLHSLPHCTDSEAPKAPGAVSRPCAFNLSIQPTTRSPSLCQSAR